MRCMKMELLTNVTRFLLSANPDQLVVSPWSTVLRRILGAQSGVEESAVID